MSVSQTSSNSQNKTQIPIPTTLTSTTPQLPNLTSHLLVTHLREINAISDLHSALSDSLSRTGWTDRVRALAQELLKNGTCETFPDLMDEVMRRAKIPRGDSRGHDPDDTGRGGAMGGKSVPGHNHKDKEKEREAAANGSNTPTGNGNNGAIAVREGWFGPDGLPDVRVPEKTVEVGVEFLKEKIAEVVVPVKDD